MKKLKSSFINSASQILVNQVVLSLNINNMSQYALPSFLQSISALAQHNKVSAKAARAKQSAKAKRAKEHSSRRARSLKEQRARDKLLDQLVKIAAQKSAKADRLAAKEAAKSERIAAKTAAKEAAKADRLAAKEAAKADRLATKTAAKEAAKADRLAAKTAAKEAAKADRLATKTAAKEADTAAKKAANRQLLPATAHDTANRSAATQPSAPSKPLAAKTKKLIIKDNRNADRADLIQTLCDNFNHTSALPNSRAIPTN